MTRIAVAAIKEILAEGKNDFMLIVSLATRIMIK